MSSKRKWDQAAPETTPSESDHPVKAPKTDEGKTASEAAAAAAAIACQNCSSIGQKDPHDGDFTHDIDINDVRNRYMLTKGSTQTEIHEETGASVSTKGVWYPDRSKATEKDPPLYLHLSASNKEMLQRAIDKVNDLISIDLGPLVEDKKDRLREKRKWPEEKLPVALETIRNFNVRAKVVGPQGMFKPSTRVQIKGQGSGFVEQETGRESDEPMHIHITGPDENQHAKAQSAMMQQQMELHQAQMQFAQYPMGGYGAPPPAPENAPPPPPPGEQPPPPPDGAETQDAYAAYWAQYGYDVNSEQFKEWAASQQAQYYQAYAGQTAPAPSDPAPPPPPQPA
ncbi:uncharacterized protein EDB91DRAFT_1235848 [Suillus paluster]|uniref:uncharacterized protein n=1 Tax=Suillus paluster TaxID=48578 RepID=UPI001B871A7D|nr:uncharacterized protein EDB91DRAFT_1235848 [Suillus paluster]KAG1747969.1 hypothetical protein EDB91DRAFT_1235848 [Suillus paluster]